VIIVGIGTFFDLYEVFSAGVLLCLDVGLLGPRSTGLALEQVQQR
jgi:hypothetical protein